MIDLEMLEQLRPVSMFSESHPLLSLEDVFARVVRDGWAPRRPAFEPEIFALEASWARGRCLEPLIIEGDEVYLDPNLPPAAGDLVSFALSERGAAAQNSSLPAGQSPWRAGARWIKLFVPYRGYDMLLEKHGGAATATLLGGESPDAHVPLWPVRNIRRGGRLLFTPDIYSGEIGQNAATETAFFTNSGGTNTAAVNTGIVNIATFSLAGPKYDCSVQITATVDSAHQSAGTAGLQLGIAVRDPNSGGYTNTTVSSKLLTGTDSQYTMQLTGLHLATNAGVGNAYLTLTPSGAGGTSGTCVWSNVNMLVEYIKR